MVEVIGNLEISLENNNELDIAIQTLDLIY